MKHISSLEQMRFRNRPEEPKLIMVEESHIRSPEWAESRWCFKSKGPAICYNPQFSHTKFWKFLIEAASITIGNGPNRPDHRKHVIHEMKSHGFWVVHISAFALSGIDKLCGSKGFHSPEFCAEVKSLSKGKKKKPFRISQLNGVDEPETIEHDILMKSYEKYTAHSLASTSCPILAIKGTPKAFCLSQNELKDRILDIDFEPKNVDLFLDIYREHCLK
ncbi:hypothetical protein J7L05_12430 [bacterium]|nr:hypothetical protein [bacterium]